MNRHRLSRTQTGTPTTPRTGGGNEHQADRPAFGRLLSAIGAGVLAVNGITARVALAAMVCRRCWRIIWPRLCIPSSLMAQTSSSTPAVRQGFCRRRLSSHAICRGATRQRPVRAIPAVPPAAMQQKFAIPYQAAFRKELTFLLPRYAADRDVRTSLDLLARGRLVVRPMVAFLRQPRRRCTLRLPHPTPNW